MNTKQKTVALAAVGFLVGAGVGMAYGFQVAKKADESVKTNYNNGVATVSWNVKQFLAAGLSDYFK